MKLYNLCSKLSQKKSHDMQLTKSALYYMLCHVTVTRNKPSLFSYLKQRQKLFRTSSFYISKHHLRIE